MLNSPITQLTTAATDAPLAVVGAALSLLFVRRRGSDRWRSALWGWAFALLALAAALGTVVHGLALGQTAHWAIWQPLHLSLCLVIALFVVGALYDWRGEAVGRRALRPALAAATLCYAAILVGGGVFHLFVGFDAVGMLAVLVIYTGLAVGGRHAAGYVATGMGLSIAAAAIQASTLSLSVGWPFNHNGLFHVVQLGALFVLAHGLWHGATVAASGSQGWGTPETPIAGSGDSRPAGP